MATGKHEPHHHAAEPHKPKPPDPPELTEPVQWPYPPGGAHDVIHKAVLATAAGVSSTS
jgi:hypothetical protein